MSIQQSVEAPLTSKDTAILAGSLSTQNGTGGGQIACTFRRVLSHSGWAEVKYKQFYKKYLAATF